MKVTLIDHMGSDLTVVNAARVSFKKKSEWEEALEGKVLSGKDKKLIQYLAEHNHWSPFAHPQIQLHIKAPIFVARQLAKHQIGLVWNEVSRRYVNDTPDFFLPDEWRKKAKDKKQGSSKERVDPMLIEDILLEHSDDDSLDITEMCLHTYKSLLEAGVCEEQARMVLPLNTYTEWYWTGSLYAFSRVCNLRQSPDSQKETKVIADQISDICKELYPVSWEALINNS